MIGLKVIYLEEPNFSSLISKSQRQLVLLLLLFSNPVFQQLTNFSTFCYFIHVAEQK